MTASTGDPRSRTREPVAPRGPGVLRGRSFALRLALAFALVGLAGAALTAVLVNLAFNSRFAGYLHAQQQARQEQLVAALADSYRRAGGWSAADLDRVVPVALMDGGALRLIDPTGLTVWAQDVDRAGHGTGGAGMHQRMMGAGQLGPEERLPVLVDGTTAGTALVRFPQTGVLPADEAFRASVNRLLAAGGAASGLVALVLGLILARRATAPARALTVAARRLAAGDRTWRVPAPASAADEFGQMARAFNRMADDLDAQDRLRTSFAAAVAHELRTPLAILRSQVEAIQDGIHRPDHAALASLHEEILRTARLVDDLQALASAEAAGFTIQRRPVPLRPLVEAAAREFAGLFEDRGIRLETELADQLVQGDPARLRQIVANLLSNALKFTPAGGTVRLTLTADDRGVLIRVRDSGPGIPAEELPHVFDRFWRGARAAAGGSGIGLAVVRELVDAHGGHITADSRQGQGATFTVCLPQAPPEAHRSSPAPSSRLHTAPLR